MSNEETTQFGTLVLQRLHFEGMDSEQVVEGTIMVRRMERALGGSALGNQKFHDLSPVDMWKELAEV